MSYVLHFMWLFSSTSSSFTAFFEGCRICAGPKACKLLEWFKVQKGHIASLEQSQVKYFLSRAEPPWAIITTFPPEWISFWWNLRKVSKVRQLQSNNFWVFFLGPSLGLFPSGFLLRSSVLISPLASHSLFFLLHLCNWGLLDARFSRVTNSTRCFERLRLLSFSEIVLYFAHLLNILYYIVWYFVSIIQKN